MLQLFEVRVCSEWLMALEFWMITWGRRYVGKWHRHTYISGSRCLIEKGDYNCVPCERRCIAVSHIWIATNVVAKVWSTIEQES